MVRGKMALWTALIGPMLVLTACDQAGDSSGPGAVSEGEARALDEAAQMLEERRLPEGALPPPATGSTTPDNPTATDTTEAQEQPGE